MNIRIVTDSTCDLPEETIRELDIAVLPLNIHIGEKTYQDGVDLSREEFYRQLPECDPAPKLLHPAPACFNNFIIDWPMKARRRFYPSTSRKV